MLAVAVPASGQSPTEDAGSGIVGKQQAGRGTHATTTNVSSGDGSLPFTGTELGFIALAGAGLLGTGLVIRRTPQSGAKPS